MDSVFNVAEWFLSKESMTPKKLQKLVYYAYSWVLALMNEDIDDLTNKLFDDSCPQAWVHGPVFPELYEEYKKYGWKEIEKNNVSEFNCSEDIEDILNQVYYIYGKFSGNQLESITHQEDPWIKARSGCKPYEISNKVISDKDIYMCYNSRIVN